MLSGRNFYSFLAPFEGLKCLSEPNKHSISPGLSQSKGQNFICPIAANGTLSLFACRVLLLLVGRRPAEAGRDRRLIVFTLMKVLLTAEIEAEHLVGEVEAVHHEGQAMFHADAALGVDL